MRSLDLVSGTGIVSEADCWQMLRTQTVGRIASVVDGRVEIFPINYAVVDDGVVFRTNVGRKLAGLASADVAFEVDAVDSRSHTGWSVIVHGTVSEMTRLTEEERRQGAPWAGPKELMIRLQPTSITGRRVFARWSAV
jgi:nitroimidazol reductase NimA-like FMN-containing flavoprotein (pyridoxamine 5'-phosphate oxidase superfamily)